MERYFKRIVEQALSVCGHFKDVLFIVNKFYVEEGVIVPQNDCVHKGLASGVLVDVGALDHTLLCEEEEFANGS